MKRFLSLFLVLILCVSFASAEVYTPDLGMDMNTFIQKYNAIGSALGSSLVSLKDPYNWTKYDKYNVAWLQPDSKSGVTILLLSSDPANVKSTKAGLDSIQIFMDKDSDFLSLITIANRCTQIFSDDVFGSNFAPLYTSDVISFYYQNATGSDYSAYRTIDVDQTYILSFFKSFNQYYFTITLRGEE